MRNAPALRVDRLAREQLARSTTRRAAGVELAVGAVVARLVFRIGRLAAIFHIAQRLGRGIVTVVPVTSNTDKIYPFQVLLAAASSGLTVDSKAQAEQVRSIATQRLLRRTGCVSNAELAELDNALRLHLAL